jgi:DNA-binding transcriptional regulator YhcF (GntR family)
MSTEAKAAAAAEAALQIVKAFGDSIKEMGPEGAPLGPMYAAANAKGIDLHTFNKIIEMLKGAGLIRTTATMAYWIGS